MDFPSGGRGRRQMRPFSMRLFTSYSAFLVSLVLVMKMTSPVVGWRLRSVPLGAVRNRASYWAGSTRPTHPHHQPVSVPLSEKGELGHGVSRMQEGATLMKKAFDRLVQESSGTSLFFSESPVEPPKDGVAEFVTAAAKAFAQGYSRGEVERHLSALDGSAGGMANHEDKATRSHWIMAVLLTMQAMEVVPVDVTSNTGEDLALRSQVRLWVNGHSFLDKHERKVVDQHTVTRSIKAYSASHMLPLSLLPVSRVILLTLHTLHSHQLKYEAPLPSYPSTDPTPTNPLLDFLAHVARALSSALPSPAPPATPFPQLASTGGPLFGKVLGLWQAAVRGVMTFVARGGGPLAATA